MASTLNSEHNRVHWMRSGYVSWWLYQAHFNPPEGEDGSFGWFMEKLMGLKEPETPEFTEHKKALIREERASAISKSHDLLARMGVPPDA